MSKQKLGGNTSPELLRRVTPREMAAVARSKVRPDVATLAHLRAGLYVLVFTIWRA